MGIETKLFTSKEIKPAGEIASIFRQIADKLEAGQLTLQNQENETQTDIPEQMKTTIKLEDEQGRKLERSLKIKLKWVVGEKSAGETKIL